MKKPLVTVVVPVFNRETVVYKTLDSIARQSARPISVILVDNNSTDNSLQILNRWKEENNAPDFSVKILSQPIPGAAAARNMGLQAVETKWVMFFDSDDYMHPNHISRALQTAQENPQADIIGWDNLYHIGKKTIRCKFHTKKPQWHSLFGGSMATLRYFAKTELIKKAGAWNNDVRFWDDIELGIRLLKLKPTLVHAGKEITVDVFLSPDSISVDSDGANLDRMEMPLNIMAANLPPQNAIWADYVRMVEAGNVLAHQSNATSQAKTKAKKLAKKVLSRALGKHKFLLWTTFLYRKLGFRGHAIFLRPLIS